MKLKILNQLFPFFGTEVPVMSEILQNIEKHEKLIVFAIRQYALENMTSELYVSEGQIVFSKPLNNTKVSIVLSDSNNDDIWRWFIECFLFVKIEDEKSLEIVKNSIFQHASISLENRDVVQTSKYLELLNGLEVGSHLSIIYFKEFIGETVNNNNYNDSTKIDNTPKKIESLKLVIPIQNPIIENLINNMVFVGNFYINKFLVTQEEWEFIMGENPSYFRENNKCPVEKVSYDDIQIFLQKLNALTGKQFRLPTKDEWEYAAKGGENYEYAGSNHINEVAWFDDNSDGITHPVGQKQANGYGLYDMTGNVWEWTSSETNDFIVVKGGGFDHSRKFCNFKNNEETAYPDESYWDIGFRLVIDNI